MTNRESKWLAAAFDETDPRLFLWSSEDGVGWEMLAGDAVYAAPVGNVRDPSLVRHGGRYYVAYTIGGFKTERAFAIAASDDLREWSHLADVDCSGIADLTHVWAPQFFADADGSLRVFLTCSTGGSIHNFRVYEVHPLDGDMTAWSEPRLVTGEDLPPNIIDVYMVQRGDAYWMWYKNEDAKVCELAVSASPTEGFRVVKSGDWAGWGDYVEGYIVQEMPGGEWRVYMDKYVRKGIWYSDSRDWESWSERRLIETGDKIISHPDIILVDDPEILADMARFQSL